MDQAREDRINNEIIVDAYDDNEVHMGWYYHMADNLVFPFLASINIKLKDKSTKTVKVEVVELGSESSAELSVGVVQENSEQIMYVPILQLFDIEGEQQTVEAIKDWFYWNRNGMVNI